MSRRRSGRGRRKLERMWRRAIRTFHPPRPEHHITRGPSPLGGYEWRCTCKAWGIGTKRKCQIESRLHWWAVCRQWRQIGRF